MITIPQSPAVTAPFTQGSLNMKNPLYKIGGKANVIF